MNDKLFNNPYVTFIVVASVITILISLLRLILEYCELLWKSILISYIIFVTFVLTGEVFRYQPFYALSVILLVPGMLIYGLILGMIKPCPSEFDAFAWYTIAFLFYAIVIWGIMKFIKRSKEPKATEKKQVDNLEKQTPTETET